ncbi:MAG: 50S ribosomal protein L25 [Candidatus Gracilibacteria bacterium]|nr:50S ribosomal protein L25 [Candidatus Gracilibacteria bacterium]
MKKIELKADLRETSEKLSDIRNNKQVPGVLYGHNQEPITLKINNSDLLVILNKYGKTHVIGLTIGKKKVSAMIQEIQKNPVNGKFVHIDFYAITEGEKLTVTIPLNFVGESEAKKSGAMVEEVLKDIEVKCLSEDLVDSFDVDLSLLKEVEDTIRVSDLSLDNTKYDLITKSDEVVVRAVATVDNVVDEVTPEVTEEPK